MAIISDFQVEEIPNQQQKQSSSSVSSTEVVVDGTCDDILKPIFQQNPPLKVVEPVIDFLRCKSDMFKDERVENKNGELVAAAKKKDVEEREKKAEESKQHNLTSPNTGNGLDSKKYYWAQLIQEATTYVPVPEGTKSRFSVCETKKNRVKIGLKGQPHIVDGELVQSGKVDDCFWSTGSLRGLESPDPDPHPDPFKEPLGDPVFTVFCYDEEDCVTVGSSLEEATPEECSHPPLPLLKKINPSNRRLLACGRRQPIKWDPDEVKTLAAAMAELNYETGNWQDIRNKHADIFALRTGADLKDKWRNMTNATKKKEVKS